MSLTLRSSIHWVWQHHPSPGFQYGLVASLKWDDHRQAWILLESWVDWGQEGHSLWSQAVWVTKGRQSTPGGPCTQHTSQTS